MTQDKFLFDLAEKSLDLAIKRDPTGTIEQKLEEAKKIIII